MLCLLSATLVRSWSGQANTVDSSVAMGSKRHHDDWDREYDTGHVKKVRRHTKDDSFSSTQNPFQEYQSKKHNRRVGRIMKIHNDNLNILLCRIITTGITSMSIIVVTVGDNNLIMLHTEGDLMQIIGITIVINIFVNSKQFLQYFLTYHSFSYNYE